MLLPTLEYSVPVGSPATPGLISPRALRSRVLQALSAFEDIHRVLRELLDFIAWAIRASSASGAGCPSLVSIVGVLPSGSPKGISRRVVMSRDSPRSERDGARNTRI